MLYPCDTCYHKLVCKHCEEMRDFIKELDSAIQGICDKHKSLTTSDILRPNERICTRYSMDISEKVKMLREAEPEHLSRVPDDFGVSRYPSKES